jgi:hypothetical protein
MTDTWLLLEEVGARDGRNAGNCRAQAILISVSSVEINHQGLRRGLSLRYRPMAMLV